MGVVISLAETSWKENREVIPIAKCRYPDRASGFMNRDSGIGCVLYRISYLLRKMVVLNYHGESGAEVV